MINKKVPDNQLKLEINPTEKQALAYKYLFDDSTKFLFFGGGAGGGKSWLGCEWQMVLSYRYPGYKGFIARNELTRLMMSTYLTFQKVIGHHGVADDWKYNGQYHFLESKSTGSRIDLLDLAYLPSDPFYERVGSTEYSSGWFEEASEIHSLAFDVMKSRIGRHMNRELGIPSKLLSTCNPSKGWVYQNVYKLSKAGLLPKDYQFVQSLYNDNPFTAKEYGENLASITDKAMKERLMKGNWEYDDDPNALIMYDNILDMFTNAVPESNEFFISADIARHGNDKTVIMVWQGFKVIEILVFEKLAVTESARNIRDLAFRHQVPYSQIVVDEDGVGGGVVDILRGVKGFVANSTPLDDPATQKPANFKNLKAQCSYKLADMINQHQVAVITDSEKIRQMLVEELEQIKSKDADKDGKRAVQPKDEVKEMLGRSPDFADALMMRMMFTLTGRASSGVSFFRPKVYQYGRTSVKSLGVPYQLK